MSTSVEPVSFAELGLDARVLSAISDLGYETPSPIQAACIPTMLQGRDILGQAQTGTGKTAAFALPALSMIDLDIREPQLLVLAPTRELAIQVAEAFQSYSRHLKDFHVAPIYGGQSFDTQLRQLRRGVQVVVGTPGRVMDHMRRKTLKLDNLRCLVLDEADEMLRMGFIDDVEWVLEQIPHEHQTALFSATMPKEIRAVADRYLHEPEVVKIESKTTTAATIRQRCWQVSGLHKLDALTRILEVENFDAVLIFVRTKTATVELAEKLMARGYAAEALNGDMSQALRERAVDRLKAGKLDILIGTDVVARGLDVERISHVVNYDIPYDVESYVHRIGRTGRAGRQGDAILFVAPRERRMLKTIERSIGQPIEEMELPTIGDINVQRVARFKERILQTLAGDDLEIFYQIIKDMQREYGVDPLNVAAALAQQIQGSTPLMLNEREVKPARKRDESRGSRNESRGESRNDSRREPRGEGRGERSSDAERPPKRDRKKRPFENDFEVETYRIEVGHQDGVKPGNIVGAIANEAGIDSQYIGHVDIYTDHTTVTLPAGMPKEVLQTLQRARVCGKPMAMRSMKAVDAPKSGKGGAGKPAPRKSGPKKPGPKKAAGDAPKGPRKRKAN